MDCGYNIVQNPDCPNSDFILTVGTRLRESSGDSFIIALDGTVVVNATDMDNEIGYMNSIKSNQKTVIHLKSGSVRTLVDEAPVVYVTIERQASSPSTSSTMMMSSSMKPSPSVSSSMKPSPSMSSTMMMSSSMKPSPSMSSTMMMSSSMKPSPSMSSTMMMSSSMKPSPSMSSTMMMSSSMKPSPSMSSTMMMSSPTMMTSSMKSSPSMSSTTMISTVLPLDGILLTKNYPTYSRMLNSENEIMPGRVMVEPGMTLDLFISLDETQSDGLKDYFLFDGTTKKMLSDIPAMSSSYLPRFYQSTSGFLSIQGNSSLTATLFFRIREVHAENCSDFFNVFQPTMSESISIAVVGKDPGTCIKTILAYGSDIPMISLNNFVSMTSDEAMVVAGISTNNTYITFNQDSAAEWNDVVVSGPVNSVIVPGKSKLGWTFKFTGCKSFIFT